ncbi:MAG: ribonuclease J [Acidobacteriota bacterium]
MTAEDLTPLASSDSPLRVIPLGGLGEIGMNLMVYQYGEAAIVVDCGMIFPDAATLGVDVVIPEMSWLFERADQIAAVFLTHGHEDHIGAVPFLAEKVHAPVYGMPLALGFVRNKLEEFGMSDEVDLREIQPRQVVQAGPFKVEAIRVTHSIVDALAFAITTPLGTIIHTGDFKLDQTPVDGKPADLSRLAAYGESGVLLLVSDSTNAAQPGFTGSERSVGPAFERIFNSAPGRLIITTFASHIHRIQQIVDQARRSKRHIHLVGRSMVDNVETAERLGYMRIPREVRGTTDSDADDAVIITTGTQGEPSSALARMALGEHKSIQLRKGDTVIISARTIPGNERAVARLVDQIFRSGANVLYEEEPGIHVSGHASAEELKLVMNLTRPRFFIPMHGTFRHMTLHGRLARSVGIPGERIFVITNGSVVEIDGERGRVLAEKVVTGKVFIDRQFEEVADVVVRDRQHLAEDGFVIVVVALNMNTGELLREPEIITRGFVHVDESGEVLAEVGELLIAMLAEKSRQELIERVALQEAMRALLKRYFRKKMNRRPMILPVVWEM